MDTTTVRPGDTVIAWVPNDSAASLIDEVFQSLERGLPPDVGIIVLRENYVELRLLSNQGERITASSDTVELELAGEPQLSGSELKELRELLRGDREDLAGWHAMYGTGDAMASGTALARTFVIAKNVDHFTRWRVTRGLSLSETVFVDTRERLHGCRPLPNQIVFVQGWGDRADARDVVRAVQECLVMTGGSRWDCRSEPIVRI